MKNISKSIIKANKNRMRKIILLKTVFAFRKFQSRKSCEVLFETYFIENGVILTLNKTFAQTHKTYYLKKLIIFCERVYESENLFKKLFI